MTPNTITGDTPTQLQFNALNDAYKYFNNILFGGILPDCILNFSRKKNTHGFFAPNRWKKLGEKSNSTHEISLTPYTLHREPILYFSTLVHEQAHLWQAVFGKPSRTGYHNKEWAAKMKKVGLWPSDTGQPGGNETGQHMTHYIISGGLYEQAFSAMPKQYILPFTAVEGLVNPTGIGTGGTGSKTAPGRTKLRYSCLSCGVNVWGKPGLSIICGDCDQRMFGL